MSDRRYETNGDAMPPLPAQPLPQDDNPPVKPEDQANKSDEQD